MTITLSTLQYLAKRLALIDGEEIAAASVLVRKAEASLSVFERSSQAAHALYHTLWDHVSRALDHSDFSPEHADAVEALEAELAGRTLFIRLALGWISRSESGPAEFPALTEFMN
ncbi:hypothetical protein ACFFU8_09450 [Chromobacterium piscinae]|uniref:hypothetical protein n=1 Tax=Chromobacterium piscinae TaxID=686831 RepID=UPI001E3E0FBC|nr:hypothetical protein [Chromobacterium piscinae]MCD5327870.1 hypothetical protein [Chromobacterium piscinae]